jgi:hypothetical protein
MLARNWPGKAKMTASGTGGREVPGWDQFMGNHRDNWLARKIGDEAHGHSCQAAGVGALTIHNPIAIADKSTAQRTGPCNVLHFDLLASNIKN